jgi:large subunit ribosomal protein L35
MPKLKSKGAAKKRFRVTKSGKVKCSRHDRGHGHAPFNGKTGRRLRKPLVIEGTWAKLVRKMMGEL